MKDEKAHRIIAGNIARIRRRLDMSQEELADKLGISRQAVSKFETAKARPDVATILRFKDLKIDPNELFADAVEKETLIDDLRIEKATYREKHRFADDVDTEIKKSALEKLCALMKLERLLGLDRKFKNPIEALTIKTRKDAEKAAVEVRRKWQLYDNPIANAIGLLEKKGIRVIEINAPNEFSGMSAWFEGKPIIVLNYDVTEASRKRFTAFHELGHLILKIEDGVNEIKIERICDAFSSMLLLPQELLVFELGGNSSSLLSEDAIVRLKERYGISFRAIVVSAYNYGIIKGRLFAELLATDGPKGNYQVEEHALAFERMIKHAVSEGKLDARSADGLRDIQFKDLTRLLYE